jgi:hypothetical protein
MELNSTPPDLVPFTARAKFSEEEDRRLAWLVSSLGTHDWPRIAGQMRTKNSRQCRERWHNYLCPELNTAPWTRDEEVLLVQKYQELGPKWAAIAKYFPHRTDSMIKNRFNRLRRLARKAMELFGSDCRRLETSKANQTRDASVANPVMDQGDIAPELCAYFDEMHIF